MPIAQITTASKIMSHKVMLRLLIENRTRSGIEIAEIGAYPSNQRITRMMIIVINIFIVFVLQRPWV